MATLQSVDPATLPGPANNRNVTASVPIGVGGGGPPAQTTGQLWPRGQG